MKKSFKLFISLLASTSALVLSGCDNGGSGTEPYVPTPADLVEVDSIRLGTYNVPLIISTDAITGEVTKESYQLKASTLPRRAVKATIKYESSDKNIATVDENGKITAVNPGSCVVTGKSFDGKVSSSCVVNVSEKKTRNGANKVAQAIMAAQKESPANLDTLFVKQIYDNVISIDDVVYQTKGWDENFIISKSQAFFKIYSNDYASKTTGGSTEYSNSAWIIYTTENYDTYLFHESGDARNYMVADSTSFISLGKSRFDALCAVLDNLFTSGSGFIVKKFTDILAEDELKGVKSADIAASSKDDELTWYSSSTYTGQKSDVEYEKDYNIPADTTFDVDINNHYFVEENYLKGEYIDQAFKWENYGKRYVDRTVLEYEYNYKNVEIPYPDRNLYTKVDSIFDL